MSKAFLLARIVALWHCALMAELSVREMARLGGKARAKKMTAEERSESARKAVQARWAKADKLLKKLDDAEATLVAARARRPRKRPG